MTEITPVSQHRTAVAALPAQTLYDALTLNSVYRLEKNVVNGSIVCYIKITSKTPIYLTGTSTLYDCDIMGPAIYMEKNFNDVITTAEIGIREIKNLISNKTHVVSDNWMIYTSTTDEYNDMVDEIINSVNYVDPDPTHLSLTIATEITPVSQHRTAVGNLPAQALYDALTLNNIYRLKKNTANGVIDCYIKITSKTPIYVSGTTTLYDCNISGPAVYIEWSLNNTINNAEIGFREISNLISNKTHVTSDNWLIYTSNATEYNGMVDNVINV